MAVLRGLWPGGAVPFASTPLFVYVQIKLQVSKAIERTLIEQNLRYIEVTTRFTDGFYREIAEKVE